MKLSLAQSIVITALQLAAHDNKSIAVAVVDDHGELIAFNKMDGCAFHAVVLAQNKAYTAARENQPTSSLAQWAKATGKDMGYWTDPRFTGIAGGVPIELDGDMIGAIGISGLSEEQDEALAMKAI
ncbi:GlcG/HbpS family heme-binding protein [Reinekea sp.]|jgi:glc operon protein GlcG|uniref:GlcG/HbpS family heme-binding protein n=1 Tax=Reinekea sp. TaxID=1970455 RepID=UPI003988C2AE